MDPHEKMRQKQRELKKIVELHKKWLKNEKGGERANLNGADLTHANLEYADLSGADLRGANLTSADLSGAILTNADLRRADLKGASLVRADLRDARLEYADLNDVDLRGVSTLLLQGMTVIECQLNTSQQNRRVSYWKDLDIVTAGCYQGTWEEFKERVNEVYADNEKMKRKYDRVIAFIEAEAEE